MEDLIIKHCPVCNLIPIVAVRDDHWTVFCVKCNVNVTPKCNTRIGAILVWNSTAIGKVNPVLNHRPDNKPPYLDTKSCGVATDDPISHPPLDLRKISRVKYSNDPMLLKSLYSALGIARRLCILLMKSIDEKVDLP